MHLRLNRLTAIAWAVLALSVCGAVSGAICGAGTGLLARTGPKRGTGPEDLPLLHTRQAIGLLYSQIDPDHQDVIDTAYGLLLDRGLSGYEFSADWVGYVADDWTIDVSSADMWLTVINQMNLVPYVSLAVIDTNNLQIPYAFRDPADERELAPGLSFDDPQVIARLNELLDQLVPVLIAHDGFYLSIGNEVDIWLAAHPDQIGPYTTLLTAARDHVHTLAPQLAVGTTLTSEVIEHPEISGPLIAASDAVSYTYYHMANSQVLDPATFPAAIDALVTLAGDKQILFQEVGYPSGWKTDTQIGSSVELQKQFVEILFPTMASHTQIRFWSFLHIGDWGPDTLAKFEAYYGIRDPKFIEYLGTLGLHWNDGTPKPGFEAFLQGLGGCAVDVDGDGKITVDDLYALTESPQDINGDGTADAADINCLERYLRRNEWHELTNQP